MCKFKSFLQWTMSSNFSKNTFSTLGLIEAADKLKSRVSSNSLEKVKQRESSSIRTLITTCFFITDQRHLTSWEFSVKALELLLQRHQQQAICLVKECTSLMCLKNHWDTAMIIGEVRTMTRSCLCAKLHVVRAMNALKASILKNWNLDFSLAKVSASINLTMERWSHFLMECSYLLEISISMRLGLMDWFRRKELGLSNKRICTNQDQWDEIRWILSASLHLELMQMGSLNI